MLSFRLLVTTSAAALLAMAPAFGEAAPARVRGTATAIDDGSITVKEQDGRTFTLKTGPYTMYANLIPSSLDAIKVNTFVDSRLRSLTIAEARAFRSPCRPTRRSSATCWPTSRQFP
jgi:hypothetical protein